MLTKQLAYEKWLGIKQEHQPPTLYRLLAINAFESDPDVIANAVAGRVAFVRQFQAGESANLAAAILNELTRAKIILLNPQKKAEYDGKMSGGAWSNPANADAPLDAVSLAKSIPRARSVESERPVVASSKRANDDLDIESLVSTSKPGDARKKSSKPSPRSFPIVPIIAAGTLAVVCIAAGLVYLIMVNRQTPSDDAAKNVLANSPPKPTATTPIATGDAKVAKNKASAISTKQPDEQTVQDDGQHPTIAPKPKPVPHAGKGQLSDEDRLAKEVTEIAKRAKEVKTPEESRSVAEKAIVLADRAIALGKADTAKEIAILTLAAARSAESVFLARQATILLIQLQSPISDALRQSARQRLETASTETPAESKEEPVANGPSLRTENGSAKIAAATDSHDAKWGKTETERQKIFFDLLKAVDDYGMTPEGRKAWKEILARNEINARVALGILNEGFSTFSDWEQPDGGGKASSRMNRIHWIGERTRSMSEPMLGD